MKHIISLAVFLLLTSLCSRAQIGGDFNPDNPSDPGTPVLKYTLALKASPSDGGSFNISSEKVAAGEIYNLRAYPYNDFRFVAWICEGDTLSKHASYNYTMPAHNVEITGLFAYDPVNPQDPQEEALKYQLSLKAEPMNSGSFNLSNERIAAGSRTNLYAYPNTDFVFKQWMIGDSILSTDSQLNFEMPAHEVKITGIFEYNPASPANPNANYWNPLTGEVIIDDFTPGRLSDAVYHVISGSSSDDVTMITVAGVMENSDFGITNYYGNCSLLDLSRVTGVTEVPSYAFDYTNIESVYLPASIEKIGNRAFYNCPLLSSLTVYAMTPPVIYSSAFHGVPEGLVVYVPAAAIAQYQEADVWKDFVLLPIREDIRSLTVKYPAGTDVNAFSGLWLRLINKGSGQRMQLLTNQRDSYTFSNIIKNTSWDMVLVNESGDIFGSYNNIKIEDDDVEVELAALTKPVTTILKVLTPAGEDVTASSSIIWTDEAGNRLADGPALNHKPEGMKVSAAVTLGEDAALAYLPPSAAAITITASRPDLTVTLESIPAASVSGYVKDAATSRPLQGAKISVTHSIAGRYSRTFSGRTDNTGHYVIECLQLPATMTFGAYNYVSRTVDFDPTAGEGGSSPVLLDDIVLNTAAGAVIDLGVKYITASSDGQPASFDDFDNVTFTVENLTKGEKVTSFSLQYPRLVIIEGAGAGDEVKVSATSRTGIFVPCSSSTVLTENEAAVLELEFVEPGKIEASHSASDVSGAVGMLFGTDGSLIKMYPYSSESTFTTEYLPDGKYTLVSMEANDYYNSISRISQLGETGLASGTHYTADTLSVTPANITRVTVGEIPPLGDAAMFYTDGQTSFTAKKTGIVAGNFQTLSAKVDFKNEYMPLVGDLELIVDIPDHCTFVEKSVMVGNAVAPYSIADSRLTIPMARITDRVAFCIIPTEGGDYASSAMIHFNLDGMPVTQPIGVARFDVKDLGITVPSLTSSKSINVSGVARPRADVTVYNGDLPVAKIKATESGNWSTKVELQETYNLSLHPLHAVTSKDGMDVPTEVKTTRYEATGIHTSSIDMIYNSTTVTFDIINNVNLNGYYSYVPGKGTFTFLVHLTDDQPERVLEMKLHVLLSDNTTDELEAHYDEATQSWIAVGEYPSSYSIPVNCDAEVTICMLPVDETEREEHLDDEMYESHSSGYDILDEEYETNLETDENEECKFSFASQIGGDEYLISITEESPSLYGDDQLMEVSFDGASMLYRDEFSNGCLYAYIKECDGSAAWNITISPRTGSQSRTIRRIDEIDTNLLLDVIPVPYAGFVYEVFAGYKLWSKIFYGDVELLMARYESLSSMLFAKCKDGSYRLSQAQIEEFNWRIQEVGTDFINFNNNGSDFLESWRQSLIKSFWFETGTLGLGKLLKQIPNIKVFYKSSKNSGCWGFLVKGGKKKRDFWSTWIERGTNLSNMGKNLYEDLRDGKPLTKFAKWEPQESAKIRRKINEISRDITNAYKRCPTPKPNPRPRPFPNPPIKPGIDPSGYVYEAVPSNRIENVTASIYYKKEVEDMYGDIHEETELWDASEYGQENPLFTDSEGRYSWDVPQGMWQVKFAKDGYATAYSEWLPVPPPQLDVNMAIVQSTQPSVSMVRAYPDAVELKFDKYMNIGDLDDINVRVSAGGIQYKGEISLLDAEHSSEDSDISYASNIRFNADTVFEGEEVEVFVSRRVRSYAGVAMNSDFMQTFTIEPEVKAISAVNTLNVLYGDMEEIAVNVAPVAASAGRKLYVTSSAPVIASLSRDIIPIDDQGMAVVGVFGNLPGSATITLSVEGSDITSTLDVNVVMSDNSTVATPKASLPSGSVVDKGTAVTLSCPTQGATIYYTLDGSCPCDITDSRKEYDGTPIIIDDNTTIKAMATAPGMYDSEVVEFTYYVEEAGIGDATIDCRIEIYPLPVRDKLNVTAGGRTIKRVVVTSVNGLLVASTSKEAAEISINVSNIPAGIYIVNITTESGVYTRKVQKVK